MEKKSLINTLKTAKKANVVAEPARNEGTIAKKSTTVKKTGLSVKR
jgi:hypothetical protein